MTEPAPPPPASDPHPDRPEDAASVEGASAAAKASAADLPIASTEFVKIPHPDLRTLVKGDGWQSQSNLIVYSSESNRWTRNDAGVWVRGDYRTVHGLVIDARMMRMSENLLVRFNAPITVWLASGELWAAPAQTDVSVEAVNELMELYHEMASSPDKCIELVLATTGCRREESGRWSMHYHFQWKWSGLSRREAWRHVRERG